MADMLITSTCTVFDTDLGGGLNDCPAGSMSPSSVPYSYTLLGSANVAVKVPGDVGAILKF